MTEARKRSGGNAGHRAQTKLCPRLLGRAGIGRQGEKRERKEEREENEEKKGGFGGSQVPTSLLFFLAT
jgi:hypothetical protein